MFGRRREWCCISFGHDWAKQDQAMMWFELRGGAMGCSPANYRFVQIFAVPDDAESKASTYTLRCSISVTFCPFCGVQLLCFYKRRVDALYREQEWRRKLRFQRPLELT